MLKKPAKFNKRQKHVGDTLEPRTMSVFTLGVCHYTSSVYATCAFRLNVILAWVLTERFSYVPQSCMRRSFNVCMILAACVCLTCLERFVNFERENIKTLTVLPIDECDGTSALICNRRASSGKMMTSNCHN